MKSELVRYQKRGPAAVLTMNRPDRRNALNRELVAALHDCYLKADVDPSIRAVILTGTGAIFCAGMDLSELQQSIKSQSADGIVWDDALQLGKLFDLIYNLSTPTIAAVNGTAVAGGAGLAAVCDLAAATPDAKFGYPEVRRGLVAAMVMPHLMRLVGERTARYLLLTGVMITADSALRAGLINTITAPDRVLEQALAWADVIAEGGPNAIKTTKSLLNSFSHQKATIAETAKASAAPRLSEECRQGLSAFFEKRPVPWAHGGSGR